MLQLLPQITILRLVWWKGARILAKAFYNWLLPHICGVVMMRTHKLGAQTRISILFETFLSSVGMCCKPIDLLSWTPYLAINPQ